MKKMTKTPTGGYGGSGSHELYQRVKKKAGTIKASSRRWLERHLNDPYVHQSKIDGYRSRSAYKLIEINERYKFLKKGQKVIDLGAAPGGWCQVVRRLVGSSNEKPSVVGIDYLPIDPLPGIVMLEMDFLHADAPQKLIDALGTKPDVVLSDMAAPTTGHRQTDHLRTVHLCEVAADFALSVLKPRGHFLAKAFQGGAENALLTTLKQNFKTVYHVKPPASRAESVELYLLALEFKGKIKG
ncbi:RlmE family RNA methyltransferase [Bartonella taylorii]|uniref:Ribosomal RNA large subunit methyltransferase E n=1 Tax=Bartonella taylorii TaxID=33046 RepID=A0A9Q9DMC4_BARTA|nr:RlmE family RNA methyltransferase [Bartonella taylorii]OPB35651.1 23S rRNA Um-2552 2'-O-methyltransferase [Bartonella taylorii]USP02603.1 RlmE family RNA methyltransferase [Bartonella taylorii]